MNESIKLSIAACLLGASSAWAMAPDGDATRPSGPDVSDATAVDAASVQALPVDASRRESRSEDSVLQDAPPAAGSTTFKFKLILFSRAAIASQ